MKRARELDGNYGSNSAVINDVLKNNVIVLESLIKNHILNNQEKIDDALISKWKSSVDEILVSASTADLTMRYTDQIINDKIANRKIDGDDSLINLNSAKELLENIKTTIMNEVQSSLKSGKDVNSRIKDLSDLIHPENNSDEDIMMFDNNDSEAQYKCPYTYQFMTNPYKK